MTGGFPARYFSVADHYVTGAFKGIAKRGCVGIKCGGKSNYFENRSGLVWGGNCFVSPLVILGGLKGVVLLIFWKGLYLFFNRICHVKIVVGVKIAFGCHSKYFARFCFHYYAGSALFYAVFLYCKLKVLFNKILHSVIKSKHNAVAVFRRIKLVISERHIAAPGIFCRNNLAGSSAEDIIVIGFKSVCSGICSVNKSNYRSCKIFIWIFS